MSNLFLVISVGTVGDLNCLGFYEYYFVNKCVHRFGGPDPLDYISMYVNSGDVERRIPAHWHYVTFGLSDLHGDGRVHE